MRAPRSARPGSRPRPHGRSSASVVPADGRLNTRELQRQGDLGGLAGDQRRPRAHAGPSLRALHPRGHSAPGRVSLRPARRPRSRRHCAGTPPRTRSRVSSLDDELQGASGSSDLGVVCGERPERHPRHRSGAQRGILLPELRPVDPAPSPSGPCRPLPRPEPHDPQRHGARADHAGAGQPGRRLHQLGHADPAERDPRLLRTLRHDAVAQPRPSGALGRARRRVPRRPGRPGGLGPLPGLDHAVAGQHAHLHPHRCQRGAGHAERCRRHDRQGKLRRRPLRRHLFVPRPGHAEHRDTRGGGGIVHRGGVHALHRRVGHDHARRGRPGHPGPQLPRARGRGRPAHPAVGRPARSADRRCVEARRARDRGRAARRASRSGRRSSSCSSLPPGSCSSSAGGDPATSRPLPPVPLPPVPLPPVPLPPVPMHRARAPSPDATSSRCGRAAGTGRRSPGSRRHLGHRRRVRRCGCTESPRRRFGGRVCADQGGRPRR